MDDYKHKSTQIQRAYWVS